MFRCATLRCPAYGFVAEDARNVGGHHDRRGDVPAVEEGAVEPPRGLSLERSAMWVPSALLTVSMGGVLVAVLVVVILITSPARDRVMTAMSNPPESARETIGALSALAHVRRGWR